MLKSEIGKYSGNKISRLKTNNKMIRVEQNICEPSHTFVNLLQPFGRKLNIWHMLSG